MEPKENNLPKPEIAKEPPKEVLEQTFGGLPELEKTEGEQIVTSGEIKVTPKSKSEKSGEATQLEKKEVSTETKSEVKTEEKAEKKEEEHKLPSFIKPPPGKKGDEVLQKKEEAGHFDYSPYSNEEQIVIKNMSRQSREYVSGLIKQNKELSKLKDGTYLQDPQAYTLHPDYKAAQSDMFFLSAEAKYYAEQLEQCKLGKPIKVLKEFDKEGNPIYEKELLDSNKPGLEEALRNGMNTCLSGVRERQSSLQKLQTSFVNQTKSDIQAVNNERANRFMWVANPAILDYSVTMPDGSDKTIKNIRSDIINLFPVYMRSHIGVETTADMMVALVIANAEIAELKKANGVAQIKAKEAQRVEPSSDIRQSESKKNPNGVPNEFSMNGAGVEL
jgi:hypothetical protein